MPEKNYSVIYVAEPNELVRALDVETYNLRYPQLKIDIDEKSGTWCYADIGAASKAGAKVNGNRFVIGEPRPTESRRQPAALGVYDGADIEQFAAATKVIVQFAKNEYNVL